MSKPAEKLDPDISAQARLLAYYEQKAKEYEDLIRRIEGEMLAVMDPAKRIAGQRRIKRLQGFLVENQSKAARLTGSE